MRYPVTLVCALMLAAVPAALSQPDTAPQRTPPHDRGRREFMAKLDLNDKQKTDIAGLRAEMQKSMVGIQSKIKIARIDLRTLVASDAPDKASIESKLREINDLQFQGKKLMVDHVFAVSALLTPEQRKTFKSQMMMRLSGGGMRPMGHMGQGFRSGMSDDHDPQ
jgi:Spy/CpxP family protein refolding chaperone